MGKEHDLLNAGKTGNVSQIDKLLGQRAKKSGLQSIMGRSVNPNFQDEMGYSALHYAALHGHRSAVELLLKYDASANIPDNSGNYPLHLAAFNGHADVCRILINSGPSRANVNEQNGTEDTAMHSAAQSKSSQVVAVLLENHADPFLRNCRKESALDLAAQYGRMENVKLLLSYHPTLLQDLVKTHSPLHLAARNGHIDVVSNLLGCGMSVNNQCDTGTALHEAALFGKLDVCNFLLQCDVDISVKDKNQMTVMDLLMNHPSSKTKEISTLIYKHSQSKTHSNSFKAVSSSPDLHPNNMPSRSSTMFNRQSNYNDIPNPRPVSGFRRGTYDAVPAPKSKQEIMTQMNYDLVPNPQSRSASEPFHVKNAARGTSLQPTSDVYSLLGAPVQKPVLPSDEPALTPKNVKEGYTMLGVPVVSGSHMTGTQPVDYSTVRSEGVVGSPSSASRQKFPTGGREGEPLPMQAMVTKENKAYYQVEPHTSGDESHSFSTMDSRDYEEVPREAQRRDLQIPLYQTPPTHHQPPSPSPSPGTGDYGFVGEAFFKPKPTKQEESPASLATSPAVYEIPPSFKSRELPTGDTPVSQPKTCPLDIPSYELVGFRKTPSEMGPETFPMSALPGYEPMGLENQSNKSNQFGEYEVLAPQTSKTVTDVSDYEVLPRDMMSQQQRGTSQPSLAKSPPVYEIAPTPRLATEEPRPAPQPSTLSLRSPTYEFAPPPRPRAPSPPQNNVPDVPMVEKEPAVPPPRPRPYNQYQVHTVQPKAPGDAEPASKQGMPAPYEQVRLEAPKGRLNLDQKPVLPPRTSEGGDYCTLDLNATGQINPPPLPARNDISSSSSLGSASGSDLADTPGVPPPSPSMAAAAVFEALEPRPQSPEKRPEKPVPAKRTLERRPVPAPRRDSLNDKPKWYNQEEDEEIGKATETGGLSQDPFSFPPTKDIKEVETSLIPEKETTFTSLHNRYSPFGSRENIVEENEEEETEKGKEEEESSPLLYENVLFKRSDSTVRKSINKKPVSPVPSAMEEREEETKPESEPQQQQPSNVVDTSDVMDEDAEWEKIEALLMSINEIEMPDNNQMEDAGQATSVPEWLKFLGLSKYEPNFMNNGFDNLGFLNGGVLEDLDLDVIGVNEAADKNIILEAMKSLPTAPRVAKLPSPPSTVEEWLGLLYLSEYLSIFVHHGYTTMDRVKQIWEVELTSVLEINLLGHRNRILASLIEPRRMTMVRKSRKSDVYESKGNYSLDEKVAELDVFCPTEEQPTGISGKVDADMLMKIADEMINDENLKKKAEKKKRDNHWQHEPEVLLKGCVNYSAQYLGSQTVREIVGVSSTVEASRKMRMSTAKLQKIPSVILAVSVNGIKFIDARTKFVVSNHQMCNVSYITQDPEDKRVFAYIAKDAKVNKHYCHVFRVDQTQLSDVITMTIGQAFELAYEQFMHIQDYLRKKRYLR